MTTYKSIRGLTVQSVTTDPEVYAGSWSSGGTMNSARSAKQSGGTGNDNAIVAGGYNASSSPPTAPRTLSESYNGTAWTETSENNDGRQFGGGAGTNTNAIIAGGDPSSFYVAAETWNGSAWTEAPNMNTNKNQNAMTGNATAAITIGGGNPGAIDSVESWDGSSWTETAYDLNTAKKYVWATGTTTAALVSGNPTTTESLNGTTWTEVTESSTNHSAGAASGARDDCLVFGGDSGPGQVAKTEQWNGTSWTEVNDLATARSYLGGTGNTPDSTTAIAFGGSGLPAETGATEEWSFPSAPVVQLGQVWFNESTTTLKGYVQQGTGAWSTGGDMNSGREQGGYFGSLSAGVAAGGGSPGLLVEEYDGSSWTEVTNVPARVVSSGGTGPQTAGIIYGTGHAPTSGDRKDGYTYDGTSWTQIADLNTGRNVGGSAGGSQTSALYSGGTPPTIANTEIWDGSSWTEVADLNDSRYYLKGGGTTTAAVLAGGYNGSPSTNPTQSETWDGSSWSEGSELNTGRAFLTGGGSDYSSVMVFGGGPQPGGVYDLTEFWNGSSWTELADMATASETSFGTTQGTGLATYRARTPSPANATEEWTIAAGTKTLSVA